MGPYSWELEPEASRAQVYRKLPALSTSALLTPLSLPLNSKPFSNSQALTQGLVTITCLSPPPEQAPTY